MATVQDLLEMLDAHVARYPYRPAYRLISDAGRDLIHEVTPQMIVSQGSTHQAFFDRAAATWDAMETDETRERLARLIGELGIRPGDSVLDVGCGTGILFPLLAAATGGGTPLAAVDLSAEMLRCARNKGFGFSCLQADAARLPLKSRAFAWVICNAVFPHLADKPGVLAELGRVMGAAGRLVIYHANGRQAINAMHRAIGGTVAHDELPALDPMAAWLRQAGLAPLVMRDEAEQYLVVAGKGSRMKAEG